DFHVTGVQTCALPIYEVVAALLVRLAGGAERAGRRGGLLLPLRARRADPLLLRVLAARALHGAVGAGRDEEDRQPERRPAGDPVRRGAAVGIVVLGGGLRQEQDRGRAGDHRAAHV